MFINNFISKLNQEIKQKLESSFFKEEYFTTWIYNKQSEVHSRVQAIIIKVCYDLGFDVEVERSFNYSENNKTKRFKPDITLYKNNKLFAFIEYESTNSSDSRYFEYDRTSDLKCLDYYSISKQDMPRYWIIISTLPKFSVESKNWGSWDYYKKDNSFIDMIKSPFNHYFSNYQKETKAVIERNNIKSKIYLLNLNKNKIDVECSFND
jgi:hypothetical protein